MNALLPNTRVPDRITMMIVGGWLAFLAIFWSLAPLGILPNLPEVGSALAKQAQSGAVYQLIVSFMLSLEALAYSTVIGLGLSYLATIPLFRTPVKLIAQLRFLGLAGLILIFWQVAPDAHAVKVIVLTFAIVTFLVNSMLQVIDDIPPEKFDYARTLGLSRWQVLREVVIRGTLAEAIDAVRLNMAMAWMMLTVVEPMARSEGGIGVLLHSMERNLRLSDIFAIQIMIFVVGIAQDRLLKAIKGWVCPYTVRD